MGSGQIIEMVGAILGMSLVSALTTFGLPGENRRKKIALLKEHLSKKLTGNIAITARDVVDIGRGLGASASMSAEALYQLFAESQSQENYNVVRKLLDDIGKEDPFEAFPEVTRPSLARISRLCEESPQATDRQLLHPITKTLQEYQEMKRDHASMNRRNRISYFVTLISLIIGAYGVILAYRSPSKEFIANKLPASIIQELKAQQVDLVPSHDAQTGHPKEQH
jgi:hypothetical protein